MAVHLSRKVVEHIGRLEDGYWDNSPNEMDDGDTLWIRNQWGGETPYSVSDLDLTSDDTLEVFLEDKTRDQVDILRDDYGRFQYLLYRYDQAVGASKIVDQRGINHAQKISYAEPKSEWQIDRDFDDKRARCYGNWSCENTLEGLIRNYKNSTERYRNAYRSFARDYRDFYEKWNPNDGDVAAYLRSQNDFISSADTYARDKAEFDGYWPDVQRPRDSKPYDPYDRPYDPYEKPYDPYSRQQPPGDDNTDDDPAPR